MFRHLPFLLALLFLNFFVTPVVLADESDSISSSLQDRYRKSKFYYNQLETDSNLGAQRKLWLKSSSNFRKVYLANPKSELAPASLYMLGKIYLRMYEKFQHKADLQESIGYYHDCASLFPHHRLADDALLALGDIHFKKLSDYEQATQYYSDVVSQYSMGDMHPQAATQLKILSSNFNTALPNVMVGNSHPTSLKSVFPVKYWSSDDYSRVIINASGPVTYSAKLVGKDKSKPRRLYIDFQNSYTDPRYRTPIPVPDGLLKQIRTGQYSQNIVRVVLDIETVSTYKIFSLPDPFRVVVDVRGVPKKQPPSNSKSLQSIGKPTIENGKIIVLRDQKKRKVSGQAKTDEDDASANVPELTLAQQLGLGVRKIVIDPGHGGKDPGAIANGLKEKDIVLKLSKKLQKNLAQSLGCEVVLTRSGDSYLSLEERTAIANGNNADLFLSLHVNAHPIASVRGFETYFLNLSSNREAMRVAAFENATSELQMSDLQDVLADIMKNSKINESSRLAHNVHNSVISGFKEDGLVLKDLGVKQAPFYVLIGAEMPAILVELAFISNPEEAEKLGKDDFLDSFSATIVKGIRSYIDSNTARLDLVNRDK